MRPKQAPQGAPPANSAKVFALIDCNNFFVSCERIFQPNLEGQPVMVLSSNDGCVVARSNEAKAVGVPMGAPAFKQRQLFKDKHVVQFSGNFELYGDISRRITAILARACPRIEVYSVDESFLDLTELIVTDYETWGAWVRECVWREVGVPVSIGIAPTKTLAKLASEAAKQTHRRDATASGVLSLLDKNHRAIAATLANTPIEDVWGIGWRLAPKLRAEGVSNALALAQLRPQRAQQLMGIHGRQLVTELNGTACYRLEELHKERESIACTRTFGEDTSEAYVLEAAIASLATQAAFRLRRAGLLAQYASVFVATNKHKPGYRRATQTIRFAMPTDDSGQLLSRSVAGLGTIYQQQQSYHRAGILLHNLVPATALQTDLLGLVNVPAHERARARMAALDAINSRYGKNRLHYAAEDLSNNWRPKQQLASLHYTTQWTELPKARIS